MVTVLLAPVFVILITELIFSDSAHPRSRFYQAGKTTGWLCRSYGYGFVFNLVIVEVMKGITGSPRPTFFYICEPRINGRFCNGTDFVPNFECTNKQFSTWYQTDSYHSFPSGHTSFAVYCGFFCAWYLQKRAFNWRSRTIFLVPLLQMVLLTYSAYCSLSRITDHRHHWWDVAVGAFIGIICVLYTVLVLCKNFAFNKSNDISSEGPQTKTLLYDRSELT
ncbi:putative phosphatidate phosphatase [Hyposmocoma kahamanoa]|uniref:putative phosphatidate phosphatase n=1 Tax=Hyposmocoma kahamanoa TaxID=1477025 RepID=UPI000E6D825C|nr:putative phosphatidate phosphatase [Hyposmocoma kahamanoa]